MVADYAYIRKHFYFDFDDDCNKVEIDDDLRLRAFWNIKSLDFLSFHTDKSTGEKIFKNLDRADSLAYIDLPVGTFSSSEDEYSRVKETFFEFFDEDVQSFLLERINIEKDDLLKMKIPDIFIPYSFYAGDFSLKKIGGFQMSHLDDEIEDFETFSKKDRDEDNELALLTKETKKLLPFVFYSAQQINIRVKRGEPILTLDEANKASLKYEPELICDEHMMLPFIKRACNANKRYFPDGGFITWNEKIGPKFSHAIFDAEEGQETTVDLFCKVNGAGFISAGHFAYGTIRRDDEVVPFLIDGTGFFQTGSKTVYDFWWSNMFGCKLELDAKTALWTKNFRDFVGLRLTYLDMSA